LMNGVTFERETLARHLLIRIDAGRHSARAVGQSLFF
jgi:hypothetical protein